MTKIIAEFCQNHNGDENILDEMIQAAAENGAAYGKIQTIFADDLSRREEFEQGLTENDQVKVIKRPYQPEYDRLKTLELTYEQQENFVSKCCKYGLEPLTTCFTRGSVQKIRSLGMKTIKVASYDCSALPLIKDLAKNFDHLIISTGATYDNEIEEAATYLKNEKVSFSLLHCVTIYPTPLDQIHLNRMEYLKTYTPSVGLSEHTHSEKDGIKASIAAIYHDAKYIERHFTVLGPSESKDGPVSINPAQLKALADFSKLSKDDQFTYIKENIPEYESMLGSAKRDLTDAELLNRAYYRGRFATHLDNKTIFNWEQSDLL
jgi:N,N'-diacetyllegionaminate synthase